MTGIADRLAAFRAAGRVRTSGRRGLGDLALARAAEAPDRVVLREGDTVLTRGEMLGLALRLGGALRERGVAPGAVVAFQLPNWWEACVINLAAALFGYRLLPLLTMYRTAELSEILPASGAEVVFAPSEWRGTRYADRMAGLDTPPRHLFTVRGDGDGPDFADLLDGPAGQPACPDPDDAKLILFTSGSTGRAKGVIHSHATIDAVIETAAEFWGIGPDDRLYVPSPIAHIGGSLYAFEFPWITGCETILSERWDAATAVAEMDRHGVTFMAGATPFLISLIAAAKTAGSTLPNLRRFVCGGASVQPDLVRAGLDAFPNATVSRAYGSTEVPLVCPGIRTRAEAGPRADTDGEVAAELRLLDETGAERTDDAPGEIAVRCERMFLGYLDPADDAAAFTADGFFRMGDLGRVIDGRYLQITGRSKDIIIRKGENISPLEIETALLRHPAVRAVAVIGLPDAERGEMVTAFVVPEAGTSFTFAQMTVHLAALDMAKQKFPERLDIVEALPLTAVGKVRKDRLRAMATGSPRTEGQDA
jgi:acyl-CoA synthetase (AMP-forming)/AMP-acid ligase II